MSRPDDPVEDAATRLLRAVNLHPGSGGASYVQAEAERLVRPLSGRDRARLAAQLATTCVMLRNELSGQDPDPESEGTLT